MRHSLNQAPVESRKAGVANSVAAIDALIAYRIFCSLKSENVLQTRRKNLRHLVDGSGVCKVFILFRSLGIKL